MQKYCANVLSSVNIYAYASETKSLFLFRAHLQIARVDHVFAIASCEAVEGATSAVIKLSSVAKQFYCRINCRPICTREVLKQSTTDGAEGRYARRQSQHSSSYA